MQKIPIEGIAGFRSGRVVIQSVEQDSDWVICRCDCGAVKRMMRRNVLRGLSKSCGCSQIEAARKNIKAAQKQSILPNSTGALHKVVKSYRSNAAVRGLEFNLSIEEVRRISTGPCFYCGDAPSMVTKCGKSSMPFVHNGIDRIDSNKCYTVDNVRSCCRMCNAAKGNIPDLEFRTWINGLISRRQDMENIHTRIKP